MRMAENSGITPAAALPEQTVPSGILAGVRAPAVPVALALIAGIVSDRLADLAGVLWIGIAVCALACSWLANRWGGARSATLLLLATCCALGGARHALRWSAQSPHDVSRYAASEPVPVKLVGVIGSPVTIRAADRSRMTPPWMRIDRSQCLLRCESLVGLAGSIPTAGRVQLFATGHLLHANVGDRVEVTGRLFEPRGVQNPGGFDYRSYLRRAGIRCLLDVEHPEAVQVLEPHVNGRIARFRARLRDECEEILIGHLDRRSAPLAVSLLLGDRSLLPQDVREAFAESGTVHLLAISGLHVGILAGLLLVCCRMLNVSVPMTTFVVMLGVLAYAFVTNHRPPVIRASVLAVTVAAGWPWFRRAGGMNLIAVCAATVLLINPTDLFDVGTQLSFLAVLAIGWGVSVIGRWRNDPWRPFWKEWLFDREPGLARNALRFLAEGYVITAAIWFVTMPLVAARFHIVAPVGFLLNVVLLPYVGVVLWFGFTTLLCGLMAPWIVRWPAAAFDWLLQRLQDVVGAAAQIDVGHASVAGPSDWWLVGFYTMLTAATVIRPGHRLRRWAWRGVSVWVVVGLAVPFLPQRRDGLRCTFLAVGHGCAVVVELPGGETLLYDAGMFANAQRGEDIIRNALWERDITQLDAILISHADVDHFNAAAGLMQTMPVGTLCCSPSFLDFDQEPVAALCEAASRERVPIRLLQQSDRLRLGGVEVELTVLHPPPRWRSEHDNANSLVLRIRYANRTVLLTGDLERDGLAELLQLQKEKADLMLSPHHGSPKANPIALNEWASPRLVVISGGDARRAADLRGVYNQAERVLSTRCSGAITVRIASSGAMAVDEWAAAR